jgi:hypothetical protein
LRHGLLWKPGFKPLKDDIDHMRSLMGMEKLPNLNEDEEKLTPE